MAAYKLSSIGAWVTHIILAGSWVCGTGLMSLLIYVSFSNGYRAMATLFFLIATRQFMPPKVKRWPWFYHTLMDLKPRNYYDSARLRMPSKIGKTKSLLCYHPHGCTSAGFTFQGAYAPELESLEITWFVAQAIFWLPLFSIVSYWHGGIRSADKNSMKGHMEKGRNVGFIPGGFEEATLCKFGKERIFISKRKGFIKFALRYGYALYPVYTFGECYTYYTFSYFEKIRMRLNALKIPTVCFFGNPLCPFLPRPNIKLLTCIGEPLQVPLIADPTPAQINEWHEKYVTALCDLFERHKAEAGCSPDTQLEVY